MKQDQRIKVSLPGYLVHLDYARIPRVSCDVAIFGTGLASLMCAHILERHTKDVLIFNKGRASESNTYWAQGGIAAVMSKADSIESHIEDTMKCGRGLSDPEIVKSMVQEGRDLVMYLIRKGLEFDREGESFHLGKEGGHSAKRVLHKGDRTGRHMHNFFMNILSESRKNIEEDNMLIDIITVDGEARGAIVYSSSRGYYIVEAKKLVIATGGAGRLFRETTNSTTATGDGIAACLRAGAVLRDMEFMQFHPTVLYIAGAPRKLITEAIRGEGAYIVDSSGERFLYDYHKDGELAPRDIISRSIASYMEKRNLSGVYLDIRHFSEGKLSRYPELLKTCLEFGIDPAVDLIPIRPAAHYFIGGVKAGISGETNIRNLYVIGESSATNFHGANRLASNSLLECIVMGSKCAESIGRELSDNDRRTVILPKDLTPAPVQKSGIPIDIEDMRNSLATLMLRSAGVSRDVTSLEPALSVVEKWKGTVLNNRIESKYGWELQNMLAIAECVLKAAMERKESRGVHFRKDFPEPGDEWLRHIEFASNTQNS